MSADELKKPNILSAPKSGESEQGGLQDRMTNPEERERFRSIGTALSEILSGASGEVGKFEAKLTNLMGPTDCAISDDDKKARATEYLQEASRWCREQFPPDVIEGEVKLVMRATGNNIGLLFASLLFDDESSRSNFLTIMSGVLQKKAQEQGVSLKLNTSLPAHLINNAMILGQNYPLFSPDNNGRASLIGCLEEVVKQIKEEASLENQKEEAEEGAREKLIENVIAEKPPGIQNDSHIDEIRYLLYLGMNSFRKIPQAELEQIFRGIDENKFNEILWRLLDPNAGIFYSDTYDMLSYEYLLSDKFYTFGSNEEIYTRSSPGEGAQDRQKYLTGLCYYIIYNRIDLTPTQRKLLGLALADPRYGVGSKSAYSVNNNMTSSDLLYLATLVSHEDEDIARLIGERAIINAENLLEENSKVQSNIHSSRVSDTLSMLTIGLNQRDPKYYEKYFELMNTLDSLRCKIRGQEVRWDFSTVLSLQDYASRKPGLTTLKSYATSYASIYDHKGPQDYSMSMLKRGFIGMNPELSRLYIEGGLEYCLSDPQQFFDRLKSIIGTRRKELDLSPGNSIKILVALTKAKGSVSELPAMAYYSDNYNTIRGCVSMVGGEAAEEAVFSGSTTDGKVAVNWDELDKLIKGYERKDAMKRQIALSLQVEDLATGIDADLEEMVQDEEFNNWREGVKTRLKELLGSVVEDVTEIRKQVEEQAEPNRYMWWRIPYQTGSGFQEYINEVYEKETGRKGVKVDFSVLLDLYLDRNFTFQNYEELINASSEVFYSRIAEIFNTQVTEYRHTFLFPEAGSYELSRDYRMGVISKIPEIRTFIEDRLLTLDPNHPIVIALNNLGVNMNTLIPELAKYDEDIKKSEVYRYYGNDDYPNLRKALSLLHTCHAIRTVRNSESITIQTGAEEIEILGATSAELESGIGRLGSRSFGRDVTTRIVPVDFRSPSGGVTVLSGPTGAGKSVGMDAILSAAMYSFIYGIPTASSVRLTPNIRRPENIGNLSVPDSGSRSLFQTMAQNIASAFEGRIRLHALDEPLMGCPGEYRAPLTLAVLMGLMGLGDNVVIATHQAEQIAMMMNVVYPEGKIDYMVVDPQTHKVLEGIGGSYGIQMLEMQNTPGEFMRVLRDIAYASDQSLSGIDPGPYDVTKEVVDYPENDGTLDRLTLESAKIESCLRTLFSEFIEGGDLESLFQGFVEYMETVKLSDRTAMESAITKFENMPIEKHRRLVASLRKVVGIDKQLRMFSNAYTRFSRVQSGDDHQRYKEADVNLIAELIKFGRGGLADEITQEEIEELAEFFPDNFVNNFLTVLRSIKEVEALRDETFERKAIIDFLGNKNQRVRFFDFIQQKAQGNSELSAQVEMAIKESDVSTMCEIFDKMYKSNPENFFGKIESYDIDTYMNWLLLLYRPYFENVQGKFSTDVSSHDLDVIKRLNKMVSSGNAQNQLALLLAFASREDSPLGEYKLTKPREQVSKEKSRFPVAYRGGYNFSLIGTLGGKRQYKPQDFFFENNAPMDAGPASRSLYLTGIQGGGKTETLRLTAQILLFDWLFGRVPAREAVMYSHPQTIINVIQPPRTEGTVSSFTGEATRLGGVVRAVNSTEGAVILYDEPANGTADSERDPIIAALNFAIDQRGGTFMATNHNNGVYPTLAMLDMKEGVHYKTIGFIREEGKENFRFRYNLRAGAETFRIAREMGIPDSVVDLAEYLYQVQTELEQHRKRLLF